MKTQLIIHDPNSGDVCHELTGPCTRIGRNPENDVVIEEPSVSGHHAEIRSTDEGFEFVDCNSSNGSWINDQRVLSVGLQNGDRLRLGDVDATYTMDAGCVASDVESHAPIGVGGASTDASEYKDTKQIGDRTASPEATVVRQRRAPKYRKGVAIVVLVTLIAVGYTLRKPKAEKGNPEVLYAYGIKYRKGEGVPREDTKAAKFFRDAAEQGYAPAQFELGYCYANGRGVARDDSEAVKWYRKAVNQGDTKAQRELGFCYAYGRGVAKDDSEALKWYRRAADQGEAEAQHELGIRYEKGIGVTKDDSEALKWCRRAADQGEAKAQRDLGLRYHKGRGVTQDDSEAVKWFRKAAENGEAGAHLMLASMYANGSGVQKSEIEAKRWLDRLSKLGTAENKSLLNEAEAVSSYRSMAEKGLPEAQYNLGLCYLKGEGVGEDFVQAVKWFRKAADQGLAEAQYNLGICYSNGKGVVPDEKEGMKWFLKSAEQGNADGEACVAIAYAGGKGVERNLVEAIKWCQKSAEHGNAIAQCLLGETYSKGLDLTKDDFKAAQLFRKSADQGYGDAQRNLGMCYATGRGVDKDDVKAYMWLSLASRQNSPSAKEGLALLEQRMDNDQITAAKRLASSFTPRTKTPTQVPLTVIEKSKATGVTSTASPRERLPANDAREGRNVHAGNWENAEMLMMLGIRYAKGEGVEKDDSKAVELFRKAATQGFAGAQGLLGMMYASGRGVPKDNIRACAWLTLGAAQEYDNDMRTALQNLQQKMTAEQIAEAKQLAKTLVEPH